MDRQSPHALTLQVLATMDQSPFTTEQLAGMNDETRAFISGQQDYCRQHSMNALYRIAVEGKKVNVALASDVVVSPDRRTARIVTDAGDVNGRGVAWVNSHLNNDDEIFSTLCDGQMLFVRDAEDMPEDFLLAVEVA